MAKIKPLGELEICPFCKKNDEVEVYSIASEYFYVGCAGCTTEWFDFTTAECRTQEEAEANWNMRPAKRQMMYDILSCPLCGKRADWKPTSNSREFEMLGCLKGCGARTMAIPSGSYKAKRHILSIWNEEKGNAEKNT